MSEGAQFTIARLERELEAALGYITQFCKRLKVKGPLGGASPAEVALCRLDELLTPVVLHVGWGAGPDDGDKTVRYEFDSEQARLGFIRGMQEGMGWSNAEFFLDGPREFSAEDGRWQRPS